jgi:hypothetical protein
MKKLLLLSVVSAFTRSPFQLFGASGDGADYRHTKTATASSGAATLNNLSGTITTESLTTAAAASYTLTLTNSHVRTDSIVNVEIDNGSNTQGIPVKGIVTPGSGSVVIKVWNLHATQALNGTLKLRYNLEP